LEIFTKKREKTIFGVVEKRLSRLKRDETAPNMSYISAFLAASLSGFSIFSNALAENGSVCGLGIPIDQKETKSFSKRNKL
jgi:hypothetical protein